MDSSLAYTEGLEFPSIRRESTGSYNSDEFMEGLNFGNLKVDAGSSHSSMDSLVGETQGRQRSENEPLQMSRNKENEEQMLKESVPGLSSRQEKEQVRRRVREDTPDPPPRNQSSDDLQGFEIVETSEIENDSTRGNDNDTQSTKTSYLASGVGYVRKIFGHS